MPKKRNALPVPELEAMVRTGAKRFIRKNEGEIIYSLGRHSFERLAKDSGAVIHYGNSVLIDTEKINKYLEAFYDEVE